MLMARARVERCLDVMARVERAVLRPRHRLVVRLVVRLRLLLVVVVVPKHAAMP